MPQALLESRKARKLITQYCCFWPFQAKYMRNEINIKAYSKNFFCHFCQNVCLQIYLFSA